MKRNAKSVNSGHAPRGKRAAPKRTRLGVDERRGEILKAAKALFLQQGYAATSLEQVVAHSGGSLATVYRLFGNKEGLWRAIVGDFTTRITAPLFDPSAHDGHLRDTLLAMAMNMTKTNALGEIGGGIRLMLAEGGQNPELARSLFEEGPDRGKKLVAAYLAEENAAGRIEVADPATAAAHFCNLVVGDRLLRNACGLLKPATPEEDRPWVEAAVDMFLRAYGVKN